jgi:hypothetical protein
MLTDKKGSFDMPLKHITGRVPSISFEHLRQSLAYLSDTLRLFNSTYPRAMKLVLSLTLHKVNTE